MEDCSTSGATIRTSPNSRRRPRRRRDARAVNAVVVGDEDSHASAGSHVCGSHSSTTTGAGDTDLSGEALRERVVEAGHEVSYFPLTEPGWEEALARPRRAPGGGRRRRLGGQGPDVRFPRMTAPVTLLPVGSANNVAGALGISRGGGGRALDRRLGRRRGSPVRRRDRHGAVGAWRPSSSRSAAGCSARCSSRPTTSTPTSTATRRSTSASSSCVTCSRSLEPLAWRVEADGVDLSGDFLAVEIMNIGQMGPNLPLAPDAEPGDGFFDVVAIGERRSRSARVLSVGAAAGSRAGAATVRAPSSLACASCARRRLSDFTSTTTSGRRRPARTATGPTWSSRKGLRLSVLVPKP